MNDLVINPDGNIPMKKSYKGIIFGIVRFVVTIAILAYLVSTLDWKSIIGNLRSADPIWLLIAEAAFGSSLILAAFRWWLLLQVQNIALPLSTACSLTLIGQFFNQFMLGSLGGDAAKLLLVAKHAPIQRTHAAVSIFVDRVIGSGVLLCIVLLFLPLQIQVFKNDQNADALFLVLWASFGLMIVGIIFLMVFPLEKFTNHPVGLIARLTGHRWFVLTLGGIREHQQHRRKTLGVILTSVLIWLCVFAGCYCEALALQLEAGFIEIGVIVAVVILASSLPISIGGHGVREGAFILMFAMCGIVTPQGYSGQQEAAVSFSLLYFALWCAWSLVGGLFFLANRSK